MSKYGSWAFIVGLGIAILAGLFNAEVSSTVALVLVVIGVVVGLLNVTEKEATPFLVAAIALLATSSAAAMGVVPLVGDRLLAALNAVGVVVAPAAVIVAVKEIYGLAKD